jgi:hypothetical protein
MTPSEEEFKARDAARRRFAATPAGKAFAKFEELLTGALLADEHEAPLEDRRRAWDAADTARAEMVAAFLRLMDKAT